MRVSERAKESLNIPRQTTAICMLQRDGWPAQPSTLAPHPLLAQERVELGYYQIQTLHLSTLYDITKLARSELSHVTLGAILVRPSQDITFMMSVVCSTQYIHILTFYRLNRKSSVLATGQFSDSSENPLAYSIALSILWSRRTLGVRIGLYR